MKCTLMTRIEGPLAAAFAPDKNVSLPALDAGDGRAAGELGQESVALVAEILDADFAGEKAVRGEVAQEGEEFHRVFESFILLWRFCDRR